MSVTFSSRHVMAVMVAAMCGTAAQAALLLNDPLQGSTTGAREGGTFVSGGWKVAGTTDCIYWHIPTTPRGAAEFDIKGLNPNECRAGMGDKADMFHMYDYTYGDSDHNYNGGYRENPYKHFVRKTGCLGSYNGTIDSMEVVWAMGGNGNYVELDTPVLSWNPNTTYRFRMEWGPDGAGNSFLKIYRDGALCLNTAIPGSYAPPGHSVRIGASTRRDADAGAPIDAIFSNLKVYDLSTPASAPVITAPLSGQTVNTSAAFVQWSGDSHLRYQVRVSTQDTPDAGVVWDSLDTVSASDFCFTGNLASGQNYYAFVRLGNESGYGPWSNPGRQFTVDTGYVPTGPNTVTLAGTSLIDNSGPFTGLGATYMSALYWAKYDRALLNSDLAFLASKDFNYIRILSQVPGGCGDYWDNRGIHPISYTSSGGCFMPAWTDYTAQLQYLLDTVYDVHGMRTEITVFGGAGEGLPAKSARIEHLNRVLNAIAGREHKVLMLEVANEGWQTGFEGEQGRADMREFAQYLADRTSILVAITSPQDTGNPGIIQLYGGSAADITTVHFSRDLGPAGGWEPVYDCYRTGLAGIPPMSSNEPVGPGSSVSTESDPIKLVMAAVFAWGANLPMYVWHSSAGVRRDVAFQDMGGVGDYTHLDELLPSEFSGWVRNDGRESSAPFTTYCMGQANKWWPEVGGATNGVVRNTGATKGNDFIALPIGILSGGVEMEARRQVSFQVCNPLTGEVIASLTKGPGERFTLPQGPRAYIIRSTSLVTEPVASIDLGSPDVVNCLPLVSNADGDTIPDSIGGRSCRRNVNPAEDHYFYFNVCDSFAYQGSEPEVWITIAFFDTGTGTLCLDYDSSTGTTLPAFYKNGGCVDLTNTNTWRYHTFHVSDAYFGNRQNAGADFRISSIGNTFYLDTVRVTTEQPLAPVIAEVTPDPEHLLVNVAYSKQLTLQEGNPPPTWRIVQGPPGAQVSPSGEVTGWTPGPGQFGMVAFEVEATNTEGSDRETWSVLVSSRADFDADGDVDQEDFGFMQVCLGADAPPYPAGCDAQDLDGDSDVGPADFTMFSLCLGGSQQVPTCSY